MDDDDEFLYGPSTSSSFSAAPVSHPKPVENVLATNGVVSQLEAAAEEEEVAEEEAPEAAQVEQDATEEEESDEEDIEFIMDTPARSLDFRQHQQRPPQTRTPIKPPPASTHPQPDLTTEYTPIQRGDTLSSFSHPHAAPTQTQTTSRPPESIPDDTTSAIDTSTLPIAHAPPSHPDIDPSAPGTLDGRSIFEVDIAAMADKPWRRPGSDISDWFNYGFDEISWEAYCYRRREMGELAGVLKVNVLNFSGMPEDQLASLPPQIRQMVMTGTSAMMNGAAGGNPGGMMGPMNGIPMMDMNMGNMGGMMNPMAAMGMNGDMGVGVGMMPMMQQGQVDVVQSGPQGPQGPGPGQQQVQVQVQGPGAGVGAGGGVGGGGGGVAGSPEQNGAGMMQVPVQVPVQDSNGGAYASMGMSMGLPSEFGMQDQGQMFAGMDGGGPVPVSVSVSGSSGSGNGQQGVGASGLGQSLTRGATPTGMGVGTYRGRGMGMGMRGRGGFTGRGRGRGGMYSSEGVPSAPPRPASPLPPGVPTGPRNQNKYKDRDGNAPAVDGLDYGGDRGARTPSGEPEDRGSRKRRSSPGLEDRERERGLKRR